MTNAEKYLKDAEALMELPSKLRDYIDSKHLGYVTATMITDFFVADAKPQLTEDERIILRNVGKDYQRIERDDECLWVRGVDADGFMATCYFKCYDHLFQFIKNGEEYSIEELLKDE